MYIYCKIGGYFTVYVHSMVGRESGLGGKNIKLKFMRVLETGGKGQEPVVSFQACFTASANTFNSICLSNMRNFRILTPFQNKIAKFSIIQMTVSWYLIHVELTVRNNNSI
jgi:hypothetical protein